MTEEQAAEGARPRRPDVALGPPGWNAHLGRVVPGLDEAVQAISDRMPYFLDSIYGKESAERLGAVVNQMTNDFLDLLYDTTSGRGRPALKTSRTMIELLVTLADIRDDPGQASRYEDHAAVVLDNYARLGIELSALTGNERRAEQHRLHKVGREVERKARELIATYGDGYRRSWTQRTLRSRAVGHGYEREYEIYRLSSALLHGASGGTLGLFRTIDGHDVHRTGPALALCPLALLIGLHTWTRFCEGLRGIASDVSLDEMTAATRALYEIWPDFRRVLLDLDEQVWPSTPPTRPYALVAVTAFAKPRWYLWDRERDLLRRAEPPVATQYGTERQRQSTEKGIVAIQRRVDEGLGNEDIITMSVEGVMIEPQPGTNWLPAAQILVQRPLLGGWESQGPVNPRNPKRLDDWADME